MHTSWEAVAPIMSRDHVLKALLELTEQAASGSRAERLEILLGAVTSLADCDGAAMLIAQHRLCERTTLRRDDGRSEHIEMPRAVSELTRILMRSGHPIAVADLEQDPLGGTADGCPGVEAGPTIFTALRQRNFGPAYVAAYRRRGRARFTATESRLLVLFGVWLGTALDHIRLSTGTERVAVTDDLTDVYNYRFLKTALNREIRRASRFGQELSLATIAVDNLQSIVAEHGELRGNLVLKEVASVLAQQVRSFDVLGRYGEEDFMLILPQTGRDGATEAAERMRGAVERNAFSSTPAGAITASVGIASFPQDAADLGDLVAAADRALQQARSRGSNTVATLNRKAA